VQEGENICFEVLEAVSGSIRRQDKTTVFRAKFSSITDKDIVAAMNSLGQPDENQSKSVDARQELDLRIGCAFTRFQTRFFQVYTTYLDTVLRIRDPRSGAFLTPVSGIRDG
jgi:DNA topoisomerase-3